MDFKILAIKPLKKCSAKFLRVLKEDEMYWLYKGYELKAGKLITPKSSETIDLYSENGLNISISAIVGKNGSGKSSLLELLYVSLFNMAVKAELLPNKNDYGEPIRMEKNIKVEIYCQIEANYVRLKIYNTKISIKYLNSSRKEFQLTSSNRHELTKLFYIIAINYSHHSLNSIHLGLWLKNVFHKNDGYKTPVVLNPFRDNGNIDINSEDYLTRSRLISNLIITDHRKYNKEYIKLVRTVIPNKTATHIRLKFDSTKFKRIIDEDETGGFTLVFKMYENGITSIIREKFPILEDWDNSRNSHLSNIEYYIARKLYFIAERYEPFRSRFKYLFKDFSENRFRHFIAEVERSKSHTTLKIRQAFAFLRHSNFYLKNINKWISIDLLNNYIIGFTRQKIEVINYLPPSFFEFDLKFNGKEKFNTLSSGEKHKIYSTSSYKYHLYNLDSVQTSIKYRSVLLIFDEIELYYHPELQRSFVSDFLEALSTIRLRSIKRICCILSTHSPFILSDLPAENVLSLKLPEDKEIVAIDQRTFGANIHDLLKNAFFLGNGSMGKFAQRKINSAINFLEKDLAMANKEWDEKKVDQFIETVSEPLIRKALRYSFQKKYFSVEELDNEIAALIKLKEGKK